MLHDLLRCLCRIGLNIIVKCQVQIISVNRLLSVLTYTLDFNASGIRQCKDLPRFSLQKFIIFDLQSDNALIVPAGKTEHFRGEGTIGIIALIVLVHLDTCQPHIPDLITGLYVHI